MPAEDLRTIFDEDPERYDRARPGYPAELFGDLGELTDIGPGARVAEVGPGTGQATTTLVASGAHVVAVELGAGLAAVLRRRLAGTSVEVVVSAFEDWSLPAEPFDAVTAFTAWHWLDPAIRAAKAAAALRPGGALATVTTVHVSGGTEEFFADVQACYERWDPSTPVGVRLPAADAVPPGLDEVDTSDLFAPAVRRHYQQDISYPTRGYLELLATYSGHRALTPLRRQGLFSCIAALIEGTYGGIITKRYLYELRVARRRPPGRRGRSG
ncbi:MAG: class I SAM-dependent methyltransferase [Pseudonocardiaceae bacterium]